VSGTVIIRGARQLLTLHGSCQPRRGPALSELSVIHDGALLIRDGQIVQVGPSRRVENLVEARGAEEIDATGRVVMPGFVDCHTHLISGAPHLTDIPNVPAGRLEARARQFINGMVRHGTTTLEVKSGYGLDETSELKLLRVMARLHQTPLDILPTFLSPRFIPDNYQSDAPKYLSWMCSEFMPKILHRGLVRFVDFRCDEQIFDVNQSSRYLDTARELGIPLKIHTGQFRRNEGVRLAVALEAISVDHLNYADHSDVEMLARSNTVAVLLPAATLHVGPGRHAPARELIDGGAAVALATDFNPDTSATYNMQAIVALACARLRMTPAEAITAATFNAACAIRCERHIGSLEIGKYADLIVVSVPDYRDIAQHFGVNLIHMALKRGAVIYREGKVAA
jgi:imidazolonepropionase